MIGVGLGLAARLLVSGRARAAWWPGARVVVLAMSVVCLGMAGGCGRAQHVDRVPGAQVVDLIEAFPSAETAVVTDRIDFRRRAAFPHLVSGWAFRIRRIGEVTGMPAEGGSSTLHFEALSPPPSTLILRCHVTGPGRPGFEPVRADRVTETEGALFVDVYVNGFRLGDVRLERGEGTYRLSIPERSLRLGDNELKFVYSSGDGEGRRPVAVGVEGGPQVVWTLLRLVPSSGQQGAGPRRAPEVVAGDGDPGDGGDPSEPRRPDTLVLPYQTRVEFYSEVGPGSELVVDDVQLLGGPHGTAGDSPGEDPGAPRLRIGFRAPGDLDAGELLARVGEPFRVPIPATRPEPMGISFVAIPAGEVSGDEAGLRVFRPRLRVPPGPGSTDPTTVPTGGVGPAEATGPAETAGPAATAGPADAAPNVLVYLVDTLRADHLGVYGYGRPTSPNVDAFARESTLFRRATAQSAWTKSSVASIFTGLFTQRHGVADRDDAMSREAWTLARALRLAGYETAGFITNVTVGAQFQFDVGFHRYELLPERQSREVHQLSDALNRSVFDWLEGRDTSRPFFAYVHSTDPHGPYTPRSPFMERFAGGVADPGINKLPRVLEALEANPDLDLERIRRDMTALYDGEIAFNDHHFGRLLEKLRQAGLYDSTLIVFVSDHGEEFLDHGGWGHGGTLFEEMLWVPLVIRFPGGWAGGVEVTRPAAHVDLLPTILDLLGIPVPDVVEGRSLLPAVREAMIRPTTEGGRRAVSGDGTVTAPGGDAGQVNDRRGIPRREPWGSGARPLPARQTVGEDVLDSVRLGRYKLIRRARPEAVDLHWVYDLFVDPGEERSLLVERPIVSRYLRAVLTRLVLESELEEAPRQEIVLDEEMEARLRALGYVQ